jgi:hypothetical protein
MPSYRPVIRVITIEFRPVPKPPGRQEIDVTPEYAVVRSGDTIVWNVQGSPAKAVVTVGNFTFFGPPARVTFRSGKVTIGKPAVLKDANIKKIKGDLAIETKNIAPGVYKYDVMVDGKVVLDPEFEIKGPGGRN